MSKYSIAQFSSKTSCVYFTYFEQILKQKPINTRRQGSDLALLLVFGQNLKIIAKLCEIQNSARQKDVLLKYQLKFNNKQTSDAKQKTIPQTQIQNYSEVSKMNEVCKTRLCYSYLKTSTVMCDREIFSPIFFNSIFL